MASVRADSIQGRARRQQLGLPADNDTPELGAPPPGLADEDAAAATPGATANGQKSNILRSKKVKATKSDTKEISTKKHKTAQAAGAHNLPVTAIKHSSTHEKQR